MNAHAPLPADPEDAHARRVLDRQLEMLERVAEVGLQIVEAVGRQVAADAESADEALDEPGRRAAVLNTCANAYARAARGVRVTLALQSKLIHGPEREAKDAKPETIRYAWVTEQLPPHNKRRQVHDGFKRAVWDAHLDFEALERLAEEAAERLDDGLYEEVMDRPLDEIVAMVCRDLGIALLPPGEKGWDEGGSDALSSFAQEAQPPQDPFPTGSGQHPHPRPFSPGGRREDDTPFHGSS